jgi:hypothetical protein
VQSIGLVESKFIVRHGSHALATQKVLRLFFAVFFAALLFAEWGSHGIILSHHANGGVEAISDNDQGHDDPCRTLICNEGRQRDQGFRFSHETSQHNAIFSPHRSAKNGLGLLTEPLSHPDLVFGIFRPPDPSFHPPELS